MIQLATTYAAVGLSTAAAYLAGVHGEISAGLGVGMAAVLFILLRLAMVDGIELGQLLEDTPTGVKVMGRRVAAVALVGMLVTTSAASPVAATEAWGDDCSKLDAFIYDIFTFQNVAEDPEHPCSTGYQINQAVEEMQQLDGNQTKVDIYSAMASQAAAVEPHTATYDNYLNDSQSFAWMKAEAAIAQAYTEGETKATAKLRAKNAIEDYYTVKQVNLIEQWNVTLAATRASRERAAMEDGISPSFVTVKWHGQYNRCLGSCGSLEDTDAAFYNTSVTLVNGTSHGVRGYISSASSSAEGHHTINSGDHNDGDSTVTGLRVKSPESGTDSLLIVDNTEWRDRFNRVSTQSSNLKTEVDNYVNATWPAYESGEINGSDVVSGHTAMFEYGTRVGNNSSLYSSTAALALMGFETPNMSTTGMMNVTYQNTTYQGLVLARDVPGDAWQANTTYNASNITGPVFIATADGNKVDMTGEFRIEEMTAKNGENIQTQNTTTYVYRTANTSELLELQQQLTELRQEIEEREAAVGGGGGGLDLGNLTGETKAIIVLVAVALIVVFRG
ncbi:hypothetical protein [Haloferax larsenii]|uniref:Envelope protein N-terminal domain-containing protein n=1 Tax=Haloferax larsenii TaxID=302484 RepID=A0A1H7KLI1_HALLR|nr:hypothetical protein [Haloferax larsenii]SEK86797.1 hypothetical protein SAMN04488691_10221 [Haloferax larsenii]